jgi:hypothetical protein
VCTILRLVPVLLSDPFWLVTEGVKVVERFFDVPLDYSNPNSGETIRIFARNLIPKKQAKTLEEEKKLPYC